MAHPGVVLAALVVELLTATPPALAGEELRHLAEVLRLDLDAGPASVGVEVGHGGVGVDAEVRGPGGEGAGVGVDAGRESSPPASQEPRQPSRVPSVLELERAVARLSPEERRLAKSLCGPIVQSGDPYARWDVATVLVCQIVERASQGLSLPD